MGFAFISNLKADYVRRCAVSAAAFFALAPLGGAQEVGKKTAPATNQTVTKPAPVVVETPWSADLKNYPGLIPEFEKLYEKIQHDIQFPPARTESHLAALLPESTESYASISNYGNAIGQSLKMFRQELQESAVLSDWWKHGKLATSGPKFEESLEKLAEFHAFLGEEIVVSGSLQGEEPNFLVIAEVRKPGLKKFLQEGIEKYGETPKAGMRVLDLQELASAKETGNSGDFLVLVRPDFVIGASRLATLRNFNERLERHSKEFVATAFGQQVVKEYKGGITLLGAADLQRMLHQAPEAVKSNESLQKSGFADVKYLVWEHKSVGGRDISQTELSFNAPRHGPAAWLAKSRPLKSLDFVSPKAMAAGTLVLGDTGQIFEDVKGMYADSKSSPFTSLAAFERMLNLSTKDDLVSLLSGEITFELDSIAGPKPVWKAILGVRDAEHLQKTLVTLLTAGNMPAEPFEEGGVAYYDVKIPSSPEPYKISYAFVDGHLIVASSREGVAEAVRLHKTGESLGKLKTFLAALPPGHTLEASAMLYQDPVAMARLRLGQASPELADALARLSKSATPTAVFVYGDESSIREASNGGGFDLGAGMVVAAMAIPNLMRSRIAANEATAVGSLRTVNTAQVTYASVYDKRGFATDLAKLGMNPQGTAGGESAEHAGFIDKNLANGSCSGEGWCVKSGYRFRVTTKCKLLPCTEYVAVATPSSESTGVRNFCTTSDGVIRYKTGTVTAPPVSATECKAWPPLR